MAVLTVLLWAVGFWVLTRPFHENWPVTEARVVRTHQFYAKGEHCEVYVQFTSEGQPRTVMFSGYAPCSELPFRGETVKVALDPWDASSVRIIGYDGPLWADIEFAALLLAMPGFGACAYFIADGFLFRRAHKAGGDRPWRSVTVRFVSRAIYRGTATCRLLALDEHGKERTFLLSGPRKDLPGFVHASPGTTIGFWLVGDGNGNVLINQPGFGRATVGRVSVPNEFEFRTMT
ncbi:hypothetical protein CVV68_15025 [Arthrobacter livingstonensis]|uniref:DUF3592 domain-containing protein n=1 Tax=Arthrobacter livingstonensis TaxID=670078 RepID=A0A2V5LVY5_9MICC|nr:DUF3592 domain-containing protein [Arthrobacter livingstonensis]PYI66326.1 hypothetical protein CVV68_15025 [Arthrobacter livingstonensis]